MNPPTQAQIDTLVGHVRSFLSADQNNGKVQPARVAEQAAGEPVPLAAGARLPARKSRTALWIAGGLALIILCSALGALLWNQRAHLPLFSNLTTTLTPTTTATSTPLPTFTPTIAPTLTHTPTPTGTPDLRERNPRNNHLYLLVETRQTWHAARDTCAAWGGHLVTIQDINENEFVFYSGEGS